jgi:hypothetical protein
MREPTRGLASELSGYPDKAAPSACRDAHCRLPTSPVHTSRSLPGSVAPTINVGADIKSP